MEGGEGAGYLALPVEGAPCRRGPQPTPPAAGDTVYTVHASTCFPVPGQPLPPLQVLFPTSCHQETPVRAEGTPQHFGTGASHVSSTCSSEDRSDRSLPAMPRARLRQP